MLLVFDPESGESDVITGDQVFYAVDLAVGRLSGNPCPSCGHGGAGNKRVLRRHGALGGTYECAACGLYYRPVGIRNGRLLGFYYSYLYRQPGITTEVEMASLPVSKLKARAAKDGKDRSALVAPLLAELKLQRPVVCVFGCSWGYEMLPLQELDCRLVGVELGAGRRELGRQQLGLEIYASLDAVKAALNRVDVVMSSHVLEHIPKLRAVLDQIRDLNPGVQLHITPCVEAHGSDPTTQRTIGRDHPIGLTHQFWRKFGAETGIEIAISIQGAISGVYTGETVAVLRSSPMSPRQDSR
jgi:hypothetical protein